MKSFCHHVSARLRVTSTRTLPDCSAAPRIELEHGDIEVAMVSRIANDLDPRDGGVREGECQGPGQLAAWREEQTYRPIDERRGACVIHCHQLEHESMGMMMNFEVV